jgi:hypothetical protein
MLNWYLISGLKNNYLLTMVMVRFRSRKSANAARFSPSQLSHGGKEEEVNK